MIKFRLSHRIADSFVRNEIIACENKDVCIYGLEQGFLMVVNVVTTILIGLVFRMVWQSIAFMIAYIPLRIYAGGYHTKTQLRCYLFSILLISLALLGIKLIIWTSTICFIVLFVIGTSIFFLVPVEDRNKPLDKIEVKVYRRRARIVLGFEVIILLSMIILGWRKMSICILVALIAINCMLVFGKIKNKISK